MLTSVSNSTCTYCCLRATSVKDTAEPVAVAMSSKPSTVTFQLKEPEAIKFVDEPEPSRAATSLIVLLASNAVLVAAANKTRLAVRSATENDPEEPATVARPISSPSLPSTYTSSPVVAPEAAISASVASLYAVPADTDTTARGEVVPGSIMNTPSLFDEIFAIFKEEIQVLSYFFLEIESVCQHYGLCGV